MANTATIGLTVGDADGAVAAGVTCEEYAQFCERRFCELRGRGVAMNVALGVYMAAARAFEAAQDRAQANTATIGAGAAQGFPAYHAYMAQAAAVRAAVKAGCPDCGGDVDHVQDFGSDFVECEKCGWVRKVEAN